MRKSLQLQAEMTRGVRRLRVRRHAGLRGRRAGRRRGGARGAGRPNWRWARRPKRASRCACTRSTIRPSRATSPPSPARPATAWCTSCCPRSSRWPTSSAPPRARRRRREAAAAAGADRVARRRAPRLRHRRAPAHAVAQLRPDGLRLGPRRRHSRARHGRAGPVHAPAGGARQAGNRLGLPRARQGAVALAWSPNSRTRPLCGRRGVACSQRVRLHAHVEHPPRPDQADPGSVRSQRRNHKASQLLHAAQAAEWAPISFDGKLQDRASYRYYWQVLERAHQTGRPLPAKRARGSPARP
jgi:hypothetical protein